MKKGHGEIAVKIQAKAVSVLTAFLFLITQCLFFPVPAFAQEAAGSAITDASATNADGITLEEQLEKEARYEEWLADQNSQETAVPSLNPDQDSALAGNWNDADAAQNPAEKTDETNPEGQSYGNDGMILTLQPEVEDQDPAADGVQSPVTEDEIFGSTPDSTSMPGDTINTEEDPDANGRVDDMDTAADESQAAADAGQDINQDGVVDAYDDLNNDGRVDDADTDLAKTNNVIMDLEYPVDLSQEEQRIASTLEHTSLRATVPAWSMYDPVTNTAGIMQRSRYIYASSMNMGNHAVESTMSFSATEYRMTADGSYMPYASTAKVKITFVPNISTAGIINIQLIPGQVVQVRAGEGQTVRFLTNGNLIGAEEQILPNQDDIDREKLAQLKALGAEKYAAIKANFSDLMTKIETLSALLGDTEQATQKAYAVYAEFSQSAEALDGFITEAAMKHPNVAEALQGVLAELKILRIEGREYFNRLGGYSLNGNPAAAMTSDAWFVDPLQMLRMRLAILRESLHSAAAAASEAFGKLEASETLAQGEEAFKALIAAGDFNAGDLDNIGSEAKHLFETRSAVVNSLHSLIEHLAVLRSNAEEIIANDKPPVDKVLARNEFGDHGAIVILEKSGIQLARILIGDTVAMEFEISKYEITHQTWPNGGYDQIHLMAADGRKIDLYHSYSSWNGQSYKYGSMQIMDHVMSAEYGELDRSISYQIIKGHLRQTSTSLMLPGDGTDFYMDAAGTANGRGGRMIQSTSTYYDWQTGEPMGKGIYVTRTNDEGVTSWLSYSSYNGQQYLSYGSYSPNGKNQYESFQINDLLTNEEEGSGVIQKVRAPGIASFTITQGGISLNRCDPYGSAFPDHCGEV